MTHQNRLALESSPYLRQHADNPVDWYPWGPEAFAAASAADKPILLSVGYSACHWCHVMAHESFENDAVAGVMNDLFVNIKVDREERPDVDAIYMEAVQAIAGRGGWPMTVFMSPEGKPFYGGTYYRPEQFVQLLKAVDDAWHTKRDELDEQARQLTDVMGRLNKELTAAEDLPTMAVVDKAITSLFDQFDPEWGGFGGAPKFPSTMSIDAVLRAWKRTQRANVLRIATTTLDAMAAGGIYDHLGGGFARYSVDREWLVPHFEKMLYDQALLARVYLHVWQATGEARFLQTATETIDYVLTDLTHPAGGWFSAEDADSEGVEGKFYVWTPAQIREVLDADTASEAIAFWGVSDHGNFEESNILNRMHARGDLARPEHIERARVALLEARSHRIRPGLDDKVLTEWNGLFLATLAEAARVTGNAAWLAAAQRNAEFLLTNLRRSDGRWMRSWQQAGDSAGRAQHLAYASDYANLIDAFTRLFEATGLTRWLDEASVVADQLVELFWDADKGGVFTTGDDAESLVSRPKDIMDNAVPSANSVAATAFLRLAALRGEARYGEFADQIMRLTANVAAQHPTAFSQLLTAIELRQLGTIEVVIPGSDDAGAALREAANSMYLPSMVLAWGDSPNSALFDNRVAGHAYVCRDNVCDLPTNSAPQLTTQLQEVTS